MEMAGRSVGVVDVRNTHALVVLYKPVHFSPDCIETRAETSLPPIRSGPCCTAGHIIQFDISQLEAIAKHRRDRV